MSLASRLASNTGKASSMVGFLVGILPAIPGLDKGNAFPAVKANGLLTAINQYSYKRLPMGIEARPTYSRRKCTT